MTKMLPVTYNETKTPRLTVFSAKDKMSALTHFIGFLLALTAAFPLMVLGGSRDLNVLELCSFAIFACSMIGLYAASTAYHTFDCGEAANLWLKKLDHFMIFVLIAGTYTPMCVIALPQIPGFILLAVVWGIAVLGLFFILFWINCPKWVSAVVYIAMGWAAVGAMPQFAKALGVWQMILLVGGGVIYTAGGILYALKLKAFNNRNRTFGSHEVFHLFVMAGSLCHYALIFSIVVTC